MKGSMDRHSPVFLIFYNDVMSFPAWTDRKSVRVHLVSKCAIVWVKLGSIRTHVSCSPIMI